MKRKRKRKWVRIMLVVGGLLAAAGVTLVAALLFLQSPRGGRWLAKVLSERLSGGGMRVRIEGLGGAVPFRGRVERIAVADAEGEWLTLSGLRWRWLVRRLAKGGVVLDEVAAEEAVWSRMPSLGAEKAGSAGEPVLVPVAVERLSVRRLVLGEALVGGERVYRVSGRLEVKAEERRVRVEADVDDGTDTARLAAALRLGAGEMEVERLSLETEGGGAEARGRVLSGRGLVAGRFSAAFDDVRSLTSLLGWPSEGRVTAEGEWKTQGKERKLRASVRVARARGAWGELARLDGSMDVRFGGADPEVHATWQGGGLRLGGHVLDEFSVTAGGAAHDLAVEFGLGGWAMAPFSLAGRGRLVREGRRGELRFENLAGVSGDRAVVLTAPAEVAWGEGAARVRGLAVQSAGTVLSAEAELEEGVLRFSGRLRDLVLVPGSARGGPGLRELDVKGELGRRMLTVEGRAVGVASHEMELRARVPLLPGAGTWDFCLDRAGEMEMALKGTMPLGVLNELPVLAGHRVDGLVRVDMAASGPWGAGGAHGTVVVEEGRYENDLLGTALRHIAATATVHGGGVTLDSFTARDGGEGRVEATGEWRVAEGEGPLASLAVRVRDARLVERDDLAAVFSGETRVEASRGRVSIDGTLRVDSGVLELEAVRPAGPEVLPVREVGGARQAPESSPKEVKIPAILEGRIALRVERPFKVRGAGLDSEWVGDLVLEAGGGAAELEGRLEVRRGTYTLFGRPFTIQRGEVTFGGGFPPEPVFNMEATYRRSDLEARVQVTGGMPNPRIALQSNPPLPEDEILAAVLFGEATDALTPVQTLELARAAASVAHPEGGGSTDVVRKTRDRLGVEELTIKESGREGGAPDLVAGKRLNDQTYVEVGQALGARGSRVRVEYELTPHFTLGAEADSLLPPGIGFSWKLDY